MAFELVASHGPGITLEWDGTLNASGDKVLTALRYQNAHQTMSFRVVATRADGVAIVDVSAPPNTPLTSRTVNGSAANRTILSASTVLQ